MKHISLIPLGFSRSPVSGHEQSCLLQWEKMTWARNSLNHWNGQAMRRVSICIRDDNRRGKLGRRWWALIGSQPRSERLHMTTVPGTCLWSHLDQGFVNFFSAHGSHLPENFSTQPQKYRCFVCYLLSWLTEKSNLRKSLSWLLQGEDVTAAGKWRGWSHWVHSQASEGNECWLSVFRSHTGPFWGFPSHFSLSGSIFMDTPKGVFPWWSEIQ